MQKENIAKCLKCGDVVQSFHPQDYAPCKCGEIAVFGGSSMKCEARNFDNFARFDERGNIVKVRYKEDESEFEELAIDEEPITINTLMDCLDATIKSFDSMSPSYMTKSPTNYDLLSALTVINEILKRIKKDEPKALKITSATKETSKKRASNR